VVNVVPLELMAVSPFKPTIKKIEPFQAIPEQFVMPPVRDVHVIPSVEVEN
jgi:hypothetical protein